MQIYISIQRFKLTYAQNCNTTLKHMQIKDHFHPMSQREQNRHFLVNCGAKYH